MLLMSHDAAPQDVALEGDAVPVPRDHLQYRLHPQGLEADAGRKRAHPADGGLVVRDVDGVDMVFDQGGFFADRFGIASPGADRTRR